jgi:hypothetical protein
MDTPAFAVFAFLGAELDTKRDASFPTPELASAFIDGLNTGSEEGLEGYGFPVKGDPGVTYIDWDDGRRTKFTFATAQEAEAFGRGVEAAAGSYKVRLAPDETFSYDYDDDQFISSVASVEPVDAIDWTPEWYDRRILPNARKPKIG